MDDVNVIPLSAFDAPRVLAGARVSIHIVARTTLGIPADGRSEWCADRLINMDDEGAVQHINLPATSEDGWSFADFALDPTDPTTAALIDRRIAEQTFLPNADNSPSNPEIVCAVLHCSGGTWCLTALDQDGTGGSRVLGRGTAYGNPALANLAPTVATLPEARRRLLIALYPPVPA